MSKFKVVVIGAGAAGIGLGATFRHFGIEDFIILEKDEVGSSFLKWPDEMKLLSPSFQGNQFGLRDLNAVTLNTSPGYTLGKEHPSGEEYAYYLREVAEYYELPINEGIEVEKIDKTEDGSFKITTSEGEIIESEYVVWACGEYSQPKKDVFPGSEQCIHNSEIDSWQKYVQDKGGEFVIIGGYESGIDSAIQLSKLGYKSKVLDSGKPWNDENPDPSVSLSSWTAQRLSEEWNKDNITLLGNKKIEKVEEDNGKYLVYSDGEYVESENKPILATGFKGSTSQIKDLFEFENNSPKLTENDESTKTEGLFLVGPEVKHGKAIFCFIYKYRKRFPIVAEEIGKRLDIDVDEAVKRYKEEKMYLGDPDDCCDDICRC